MTGRARRQQRKRARAAAAREAWHVYRPQGDSHPGAPVVANGRGRVPQGALRAALVLACVFGGDYVHQ